jgi:hypothetical protein
LIEISFHNTHSYPGCRASVLFGKAARRVGKALVEFSDGSEALGRYRRLGEDALALHVSSYVTAKRTAIVAKSWRLERIDRSENWKVVVKLTGR